MVGVGSSSNYTLCIHKEKTTPTPKRDPGHSDGTFVYPFRRERSEEMRVLGEVVPLPSVVFECGVIPLQIGLSDRIRGEVWGFV